MSGVVKCGTKVSVGQAAVDGNLTAPAGENLPILSWSIQKHATARPHAAMVVNPPIT
jgi:hypothetical protein